MSTAKTLEIIDLHVTVDDKEILKGVSLKISKGNVHVLMGPNGSGKSTLANVIMGNPEYKVTSGKILLDREDITSLKTDARAKKGLFLSFQYPSEISGVTINHFLRTAINSLRKERSQKELNVLEFHNLAKQKMSDLGIDPSFGKRQLNVGFSGGEKKRMEMLQMALLEPEFALLDETDSGLDVDAIKKVSDVINSLQKEHSIGIMLITHYAKFLECIKPDVVSVMFDGKIVETGGKELVEQIEQHGFKDIIGEQ